MTAHKTYKSVSEFSEVDVTGLRPPPEILLGGQKQHGQFPDFLLPWQDVALEEEKDIQQQVRLDAQNAKAISKKG